MFNLWQSLIALFAKRAEPTPPSTHEVMPEERDLPGPQEAADADVAVKHPTGKGIFIQTVSRASKGGTPESCADFAQHLGMDWAMLLCLWQHDERDRFYSSVLEAAHELTQRNITPWVWGWPHPARIDVFVQHMVAMYRATNARGIVLNVEAPFYGRRGSKSKGYTPIHEDAARELMTKLREHLGPKVPIGLSSYGARFWHRTSFPWGVFAEFCDFGMPQIYDSKHKHGPTYPQRCWDSWAELFDVVVPTWGASKAHTGQQMRDMVSRTPLCVAGSWWDQNHLRYSSARRAAVMEWGGE